MGRRKVSASLASPTGERLGGIEALDLNAAAPIGAPAIFQAAFRAAHAHPLYVAEAQRINALTNAKDRIVARKALFADASALVERTRVAYVLAAAAD